MPKIVIDPQNLPGMPFLRLPVELASAAYIITLNAFAEAGLVAFAQGDGTVRGELPAGSTRSGDSLAEDTPEGICFGFAGEGVTA